MDVLIGLAYLAAFGAVVFVTGRTLWRHRVRVVKILLVVIAAALAIYFMGGTIASMAWWYFTKALWLACPALVLAIVFRKYLSRKWTQYTAWWRRTGTLKAFLITFAVMYVIYLVGSGSGAWLIPIIILAIVFRKYLMSGLIGLGGLGRRVVRSP